MSKHTREELLQMQSLPLNVKIRMTEYRIREWIDEYGEDGVYVSFSGGKDSTVLLDIVRNRLGYTDVPAVFVDTGLEYPEIREFVKSFCNVVWLKPQMQFKKVIETYGYPFISKEVSNVVHEIQHRISNGKQPPTYRVQKLEGTLINKKTGELSAYNMPKWKFLIDSPYKISDRCCNVMKKTPVHKYSKESGRVAITAQMASESRLRTQKWIQNGCNAFDSKNPISNPMSFWTEQDILLYIKTYNLPICSVYGEIVYLDDDGMEYGEALFLDSMKLKTTGCNRTGCMFCGYGCHLENEGEGRFERMKVTHPKQYEWIMKPWAEGGLGYKEVIDWLNENGNLNIRY